MASTKKQLREGWEKRKNGKLNPKETLKKQIERNKKPNGRHCEQCNVELTGWKRMYCSRQCRAKAGK